MRRLILGSVASFALATGYPAIAQDDRATASDEMSQEKLDEVGALLSGLFQAEPLTPAQEARLPAAQAVVGAMMPEGFYGEMMGDMMDTMLRPMMSMFSSPDLVLATQLPVDDDTLENLDEAKKAEVLEILDPAYDKRTDRVIAVMTGSMSEIFDTLEPPMREGLSKAYAVRFDQGQLTDIGAFFATPTGSVYARESMALMADPQVMQAMMQALPAMMGSFGNLESVMEDAMAELPQARDYGDLSAAQVARLTEITGLNADEIEAAMTRAKKTEEAHEE